VSAVSVRGFDTRRLIMTICYVVVPCGALSTFRLSPRSSRLVVAGKRAPTGARTVFRDRPFVALSPRATRRSKSLPDTSQGSAPAATPTVSVDRRVECGPPRPYSAIRTSSFDHDPRWHSWSVLPPVSNTVLSVSVIRQSASRPVVWGVHRASAANGRRVESRQNGRRQTR